MTAFQNIHSALNHFFFFLRSHFKLSKSGYTEIPARENFKTNEIQKRKITNLKKIFSVHFEEQFNQIHALENYNYLDLLFHAFEAAKISIPRNASVIDVGSKNFSYAAALHAFFHPENLTGIEIDAYKLYHDGHSRYDYARYFSNQLPNTFYLAEDFCRLNLNADIITCFYPFVFIEPLLAWTLPIKHFKPAEIFNRMAKCLNKHGLLVLVSQGDDEAEKAKDLTKKSGLTLVGIHREQELIGVVNDIPIISLWQKT